MELTYHLEDRICIMELQGELTLDRAYDFNNQVRSLIDEINPKVVVMNMRHVPHIDSAGFGALATIYKMMQPHGKKLGIFQLAPQVWTTLQTTKLDELIAVYETKQEAIEDLTKD